MLTNEKLTREMKSFICMEKKTEKDVQNFMQG